MASGEFSEDSPYSALIEMGIALTSETDLDRLLERIVSEARAITNADGGSLYLREGGNLRFLVSQNDTLTMRLGLKGGEELFQTFTVPITPESIAGFVAKTGQVINIDDVYHIPADREYSFLKDFDERNDYRSKSTLHVPLLDPGGHVIGVLGLFNRLEGGGQVGPFRKADERIIMSLASQAAVAVKNAQLTRELREAHLDTIFRLSVAAEYRDLDTAGHIRRISDHSALLGASVGLAEDKVDLIRYTSPMHDVGKIGVPDAILLKPGKLTPEERAIMEQHTVIGAKILENSDAVVLKESEVVAISHHEKWDGSGYPNGLAGEDIPLEGRIVAVADVFDALSSPRCYKPAFPQEKVMSILKEGRGNHFDPGLLDAFFDSLEDHQQIRERYRES
ncbi:MAG: HD domain-containing phosphohydrolase [Planctomycetota bacterium]|jgi:GAF domain-containing protein